MLALADDRIQAGKTTEEKVIADNAQELNALKAQALDAPTMAAHAYAKFEHEGASKAIAAQYLAERLEGAIEKKQINTDQLREKLPPYVVAAIAHVTRPFGDPPADDVGAGVG